MFGKARETSSILDTDHFEEFFGDEIAAQHAVDLRGLRDRVDQVESQISSQFTSLATYAQIAQEQVELARAEARAATERSEHRLTSLIERERADRIAAFAEPALQGSPADVTARLDALEQALARLEAGLGAQRVQQKELAGAITAMFERLVPAPSVFDTPPKIETAANTETAAKIETAAKAETTARIETAAVIESAASVDGPISELSLVS